MNGEFRAAATCAVMLILAGQACAPRDQPESERLVRQLGEFPAAFPGWGRSDGSADPVEERRHEAYARLFLLGPKAAPALARGLAGPDVRVRRGVALFLYAAGDKEHRALFLSCVPALIAALRDPDERVRELAPQALIAFGPEAPEGVAAVRAQLAQPDADARRNACWALRGSPYEDKRCVP